MPTMRDVARKVGVAQSTVSRVLNGDTESISITQETRDKILEAAYELGYRIDPLARAMRGKSSRVIGIILRDFDSIFLPRLTAELSNRFQQRGYDTIVTATANNLDETLRLQTLFETQLCDGLILAADPLGFSEAQTKAFFNKPLVMTAWGSPVANIPMVNTDNQVGARLAMEHLLELGHERIAFLDVGWSGDTMLRRETYVRMMDEAGLDYRPYLIGAVEGMSAGYQATQQLLKRDLPPSAIFAAEDFLAFGALKAAYDNGFRVPHDLSIVGFDDHPYAEFSVPALTTIHQPIGRIAKYASQLLIRLIDEEAVPESEQQILVQPELITRESTSPPSKGN